MRKFVFLLSVVLLGLLPTGVTHAQDTGLATLEHNGSISVFYGAKALAQAVDAAVDGDVVTLSAFMFNAVDITKRISIYGAGAVTDSLGLRSPTVVNGDFKIKMAHNSNNSFIIEGIYFSNNTITIGDSLINANFNKCRFYNLSIDGASTELLFNSCRFIGDLKPGNQCDNIFVNNSVIRNLCGPTTSSAGLLVQNCVCLMRSSWFDNTIANFRNAVLGCFGSGYTLNKNSVTSYCVLCNYHDYASHKYNSDGTNFNSVGPISDDELYGKSIYDLDYDTDMFILTDDAAAKYLGQDGTQVGIHGGSFPFSDVPQIPQITKRDIAVKTSNDGKLDVDIKVEVQN